VCLGNSDGIKKSDSIQVPSVFKPRKLFEGVPWADVHSIMLEIQTGQYRKDSRSPEWIGKIMRDKLKIPDSRAGQKRINRMLAQWVKSGAIKVTKRPDENRMEKQYYELNEWDFSVT
jgi:hypothetical protein